MSIFKRKGGSHGGGGSRGGSRGGGHDGHNGHDNADPDMEGAIYDIISRDVVEPRRQIAQMAEAGPNQLRLLLDRVAENSVREIDTLIGELKRIREELQHGGERMARQIAGYSNISQGASASTRILSENLGQWKKPTLLDPMSADYRPVDLDQVRD